MRKIFTALFALSILANGLLVQHSLLSTGEDSVLVNVSNSVVDLIPKKINPEILLAENLVAQKAVAVNLVSAANAEKVAEDKIAKEVVASTAIAQKKKTQIRTKKALRKATSKSVLHAYSVSLTSAQTPNEISLNVKGVANESFGVYIISKQGKVEAFYEFAANTASERKMALNISHLDKGTYFAHLVGKGDRVVKKFVKI